MRLTVRGDLNSFYAQTLCLIYFPGARFSEKREDDGTFAEVALQKDGDRCFCDVTLGENGRVAHGSFASDGSDPLFGTPLFEKAVVAKAFLQAGEKLFGFLPPWGILTGVRPSKLVMADMERGMGEDDCRRKLENCFSVMPEKAKLAVEVALAEKELMTPDLRKKCSFYIAIPFCPSKCSYCSFVSFTSKKLLSLIPEYLEILKGEIRRKAALIKRLGIEVSCIYIGGGTPTVLTERELSDLLSTVSECFDVSSLDEFTLEAGRPDTITEEKLKVALANGVTRISVNPQTLDDNLLESLGRRHTADMFFKAFEAARNVGIPSVNIDLIAGLPGDTFESFASTADRIAALGAENVTLHTFCVKRSAELRHSGEDVFSSVDAEAARSVRYGYDTFVASGLRPYYMYRQKNTVGNLENTGYSLPGHEGIYNIIMMEEYHTVFAVGASAVTKIVKYSPEGKRDLLRIFENKYPYEYISEKTGCDPSLLDARFEGDVLKFLNS